MILNQTQQEIFEYDFLSKFDIKKRESSSGEIRAVCPSCGHDKLYINVGTSKDNSPIVMLHCKHGCDYKEIIQAAAIEPRTLYLKRKNPTLKETADYREHVYTNEKGEMLAKKCIYKFFACYVTNKGKNYYPKDKMTFWKLYDSSRQAFSDKSGLNGLKMPLYRLDKLNNTDTVYIVEGEKDVETLERMGYTATTSPNGAGANWKREYNKYLSGKDCIVLADNDEAGEKAGSKTAESLISSGISCKLIRAADIYPEISEKGDITDIFDTVGLEKTVSLLQSAVERTLDYAPMPKEKQVQQEKESQLPPFFIFDDRKQDYFVHAASCAEYIRDNEKYCFTESQDNMTQRIYWYSDGVYYNITKDKLQAYIADIIAVYMPLKVKMKDVTEIAKNICADIHRYRDENQLNANEKIINFKNGILNIETMELMPHSPDIFSSIQIPCDYIGEQKTPVFDKFINEFTDGDKEKQQILLEFIGAAISNVYGFRFKGYNGNSLFLVGKGNTGKSVLKKFIETLIGIGNCSNGDLQDLEKPFGTYKVYNKRLYGNSDTGFMVIKELKIFKQLTGGDTIEVNGKYRDGFPYIFKGFLWFCCNELPKFGGDRGEHVYNRIIPIECNHYVKPEERDAELVDKLIRESSGIIYKAIQALKTAIANNYNFSIPESSKKLLETYKIQNSPYLSFFKECCTMRQSRKLDSVTQKVMNDIMIQWVRDNTGLPNPKISDFKKEVAEYLKTDTDKLIKGSHGKKYYCFTLTAETKEMYHVVDSVN